MARTGVPAASIHHYRRLGLLPEPERAARNRFVYDQRHVEAYARLAEIIVKRMDVEKFASRFSRSRRLTDDSMRKLIERMGKHVYRGPLERREIDLLRGISTTVMSTGGDFIRAHGEIFAGTDPVTSGVEAGLTTPGMMIEIEVDALIHDAEGNVAY